MKKLFPVAAGLLLCLGGTAPAAPATWQILVPGEYHGGEAPHTPGPGWLALTRIGGTWHLEPTVVRATRVQDPVMDEGKAKTGIKISSRQVKPLILLRIPGMRRGKVAMSDKKFAGKPLPISAKNPPVQMLFNGGTYLVKAQGSEVFLYKGKSKSLLPDLIASVGGKDDDNEVALLWTGDLDGDGALDFLFEYKGHNEGKTCVFLSRDAVNGKLVRRTACQHSIGC